MKNIILTLIIVFALQVTSNAQTGRQKILERLDQQTTCWNGGDLECFMQTYWKSDSLLFIGKKGLTYGWQNTMDNYRESYPDRLAMGKLNFEILSIKPVNDDCAFFVIGKWHLSRAMGDLEGIFSLLWEKIEGEWVIVADHSS